MLNFIKKKFFFIKLIFCFLISILVYLSFRIHLINDINIKVTVTFLIIQFIVWSVLYFDKRGIKSLVFYNLFIVVILNFILTPIFHLLTFDVPIRQPNYSITKKYDGDFFKGMFSGTHFISSDEKGYRTNKKINYEIKNNETLRIFTIGGSTTEEGTTDDQKTWSSLLGSKLEKKNKKEVEVINAGMAGLRTEHHYITLKRIKKYKPDVVIFMTGINDWNYHIVKSEFKYLIPNIEIKYDIKKSLLGKIYRNIVKQINRKIIKNKEKPFNTVNAETDTEMYLLPQIDSLNKREYTKEFRPKKISDDYRHWIHLIVNECNKNIFTCIFLEQPTAYSENISDKLMRRLWMTPPNQSYTLSLQDLIHISTIYNNWLKNIITKNKLNFVILSNKIEPNTQYLTDDCHFSEKGSEAVSDAIVEYMNLSLKSILN